MREISTEEVEWRVARTVLRLATESGRRTAGGTLIDFPLRRQDIAGMTGCTLHTVSRIIAWEAQGLVDAGRQRIVVRDAPRLTMLADSSPA